jgi:uncharacterized repeat protein (TIGR01451 family)
MNRWIVQVVGTGLVAWAVPTAAQAAATGPLETTLEARKVARTADGSERHAPADDPRPGDILEYVARYRNGGTTVLRHVEATIPIPEGTEFVPGSAKPLLEKASADGEKFGPQPLMRRVKREGREVLEQVVPRDYRALRWTITLDPQQAANFSLRVRVQPKK